MNGFEFQSFDVGGGTKGKATLCRSNCQSRRKFPHSYRACPCCSSIENGWKLSFEAAMSNVLIPDVGSKGNADMRDNSSCWEVAGDTP